MNHSMDRPIALPWWKKTGLKAAGTVVLMGLLVAIGGWVYDSQRTLRVPVERISIAAVEQGVFRDFIPLRGQVVPRDVVYVNALEGGSVAKILVQSGDVVSAGQPLIELHNPDLQHEVTTSELSIIDRINGLRNTEMALEDTRLTGAQQLAESNYNLARLKRQAERQEYYFSKGITSAEERDKAVDELQHYSKLSLITLERNSRKEALRLARLPEVSHSLAQLQKDLVDTRAKLENLTVRAPQAGVIDLVDLDVGKNCARGERIGDVILDTGFKLSADIDEYYLSRVGKGQKAEVERDAQVLSLTVSRVYPQVKGGRFEVDLGFDQSIPSGLLTGQALQGKLHLGDDRPALLLPAGAFLQDTRGDWVFVVTGGAAQRRAIKTGRRNSLQVEVLQGLSAGERVIVSEYRGFDQGDRIVVTGSGA